MRWLIFFITLSLFVGAYPWTRQYDKEVQFKQEIVKRGIPICQATGDLNFCAWIETKETEVVEETKHIAWLKNFLPFYSRYATD